MQSKLNPDAADALAPSYLRSELANKLPSVVSKHVKSPNGVNRVDYFAKELKETTGKDFMAFIDCSEKWVERMPSSGWNIQHNRIPCPEMTVRNAALMELNGIRITAMRADLEAELKQIWGTSFSGASPITQTPHVTPAASDHKVIFVIIFHA